MEKGRVIKNPVDRTYFTGRHVLQGGSWSFDINDADWFDDNQLKELWESIDRDGWEAEVFDRSIYYELVDVVHFCKQT